MVKIISGWSDRGGSTFAFINLTNKLNEYGVDTTFYGPHSWHLDKCKSGLLDEKFRLYENDIVITHFLNLENRPNVKKIILSCHEKNLFEVGKVKKYWDTVVFVNNKQREYHNNYNGPFEIIPNLKEVLEKKEKHESVKNVAGVIGSIDENKQTHVSIERAIVDGMEKIYLFGNVSDQNYYEKKVKPLVDNNRVIEYGFVSDKQKIYDMINYAYLSSRSEVASLVKDECESTGTIFKGNFATNNDSESISNSEILEKWIKLLMN